MTEVFAISSAWVIGYALARLIAPTLERGLSAAFAYGLGIGMITVGVFLAGWAAIPLTPALGWGMTVALLAAAVVSLVLRQEVRFATSRECVRPRRWLAALITRRSTMAGRACRSTPARMLEVMRPPDSSLVTGAQARLATTTVLDLLLLGLIVALVLLSFWLAAYWPLYEHDAMVTYDLRARFFVRAASLNAPEYREYGANTLFSGRLPPLTSFAHVWLYLLGGRVVHVLYPPFYASLILGVAVFARRFLSRTGGLLTGVILASTPLLFDHSATAYTNLPFTLYFTMGALLALAWTESGNRRLAFLAGIALGLCAWTRVWAVLFVLPLGLPALWHATRHRRLDSFALGATVFFLASAAWSAYVDANWWYDPPSGGSPSPLSLAPTPGRVLVVVYFLIGYFVTPQAFGPIWLFFAAAVATRPQGLARLAALTVLLGFGVLGAIGYYWVGQADWQLFLLDAVRRSLMTYAPLALLVAAAAQPVRALFADIPVSDRPPPVPSAGREAFLHTVGGTASMPDARLLQ